MKKTLPYFEYLIYILTINIVTYILKPMNGLVIPKSILSNPKDSIILLISNLIIFIISVFILACFFKANNNLLTYAEFFNIFFKKILTLSIIISCIFDIIEIAIDKLSVPFLNLLIEAISLFLIFNISFTSICPNIKKNSNKKIKIILFMAVSLFSIGYGIFYFICKYEFIYLVGKYANFTQSFDIMYGFSFELIYLFYSILIWIGLFYYFNLFITYKNRKENIYSIKILIARLLCVFTITAIGTFAKIQIIPDGFTFYEASGSFAETYTFDQKLLHDSNIFEQYRITNRKKELVYTKLKVKIKHQNIEILEFSPRIEINEQLCKIDLKSNTAFYRYNMDAIAYVTEKNESNAFLLKDINKYKQKDDNLILLLEYLISEGYFEVFEYSYKYLKHFDNDFIKTYLYDFTENGKQYFLNNNNNDYINSEYIKSFNIS